MNKKKKNKNTTKQKFVFWLTNSDYVIPPKVRITLVDMVRDITYFDVFLLTFCRYSPILTLLSLLM